MKEKIVTQTLTIKIKHGLDLSDYLKKAFQLALFSIKNKHIRSTKEVKHFGLPSAISNQVLRRYGRNKKAKKVSSVKLTILSDRIILEKDKIYIRPLKLRLDNIIKENLIRVVRAEFDDIYCYLSYDVACKPMPKVRYSIGVDLNATGHCCVVANPKSGGVMKLGKKTAHIRNKYRDIREKCKKKKDFKTIKKIKGRQTNIITDINHKISRKIVNYAQERNAGIKLENLSSIRSVKVAKSFKYSLNSWAYRQLRTMIEYKALLLGVKVDLINPAYTSKKCSRCGSIGNRNGKIFKCSNCGHVEHADVNAAFNIATSQRLVRLNA